MSVRFAMQRSHQDHPDSQGPIRTRWSSESSGGVTDIEDVNHTNLLMAVGVALTQNE